MRKISLAILVCISCNIATLMAEPLKIDGLTCENLKAPLAIDNTQPHFSWLNHATYNNARQTAYELQVGTDSVRLLHGKADCWQVCKQTSTSVMVPYGGKFTQWAIQQGQSQLEPSQLVYNMLKQRSYPGYLYMIDNNATTTWEYWNGERSHVHNCYNGIGLWFYQALGGIRPTDDGVGYQRVIIAPQCPKDVTWATTTRQTPYGLLRTEWRGSQLKAQIPVGVVAEVVWRGKRHIVGSGEWTF